MNTAQGVILEDVDCPLGCRRNDETLLRGRDRLHHLAGRFTVVKCRNCGLMRTNPRPAPKSMGYFYPSDYHPYRNTQVVAASYPPAGIRMRLKPLARRIFEFNSTRLPPLAPGRMLEVGCASGIFLHRMARKGWKVSGIDFSAEAAENAKSLGYPVHAGSVETAPSPGALLDLVVGWMVLEHLHDPILALRQLHQWTKPRGWLAISIPNAGSLEFRLFRDSWYALQLPTHLYHFTPRSLEQVLKAGGWTMERVFHQRLLGNVLASIGHVFEDRKIWPPLAKALIEFPETSGWRQYAAFPLAYIASLMGQTGRMTVWARRTP